MLEKKRPIGEEISWVDGKKVVEIVYAWGNLILCPQCGDIMELGGECDNCDFNDH